MSPRPPLPPFTPETASQKGRLADAWNSRDPQRVALAYTEDSPWRNRVEFIEGRAAIIAFLERKWARELDYRLIKEVGGFRENRTAVRFAVRTGSTCAYAKPALRHKDNSEERHLIADALGSQSQLPFSLQIILTGRGNFRKRSNSTPVTRPLP
jgi:nuclear transport factor 2 (NTF2) superfamily protein